MLLRQADGNRTQTKKTEETKKKKKLNTIDQQGENGSAL